MSKKVCLVTGANSGIGKEIAIGLASAGCHVIIVCRNTERGRAALKEIKAVSNSESVDLLIADLSSKKDIQSLANTIHERYSSLSVLINNAGLVLSQKKLSVDGIEMTLATNYLGPFLLTHLLTDLLQNSAPSRIINISSAIYKWAKLNLNDLQFDHRKYKAMKAYAQSKLLMNIVTFGFARRLNGTGVTVNCVHPGAVKTKLGSNNVSNILLKFLDKTLKFFFLSPKKAAKVPIYLALSPELETITGQYFEKGKPRPSSSASYDLLLEKRVWEISKQLVGY